MIDQKEDDAVDLQQVAFATGFSNPVDFFAWMLHYLKEERGGYTVTWKSGRKNIFFY